MGAAAVSYFAHEDVASIIADALGSFRFLAAGSAAASFSAGAVCAACASARVSQIYLLFRAGRRSLAVLGQRILQAGSAKAGRGGAGPLVSSQRGALLSPHQNPPPQTNCIPRDPRTWTCCRLLPACDLNVNWCTESEPTGRFSQVHSC